MGANASNVGVFALSKAAASDLRAQMNALLAHLGVSAAVPTRGGSSPLERQGDRLEPRGRRGLLRRRRRTCRSDLRRGPDRGPGQREARGRSRSSFLSGEPGALDDYSRWVRDWGQARYAPSIENRVLAAWVGLAPAERQLFALLAGLAP